MKKLISILPLLFITLASGYVQAQQMEVQAGLFLINNNSQLQVRNEVLQVVHRESRTDFRERIFCGQ